MKIHKSPRRTYSFLFVFSYLIAAATVFSQTEAPRKPSIAVIQFATTGKASYESGAEISDLLVNELVNSSRFRVVDRSTASKVIDAEQMEALKGAIDPATAAAIGNKTGAQFLVLGTVNEFREKKNISLLGLASYEAIVKFNLRALNSTTGEIVFSQAFEKKSNSIGGAGNGTITGSFESKAMQDALAKTIKEAVATLVERLGSATPISSSSSSTPVNSAVDCSRLVAGKSLRIMVVIPEIHISQKIPDPAGETEIIKKLVARRFNVVDQKQISVIREREKVLTALKNPQAAAALGVEFGADIIIIGEAFSELAGRQENLISTRARVEARAIQTDNARILAADGKFGSGLDIAEFVSAKTALRNAGSHWADYFITQICQATEPTTINSTSPVNSSLPVNTLSPINTSTVEIMVSNISFAQLKQFGDRLEKITGVQSVQKKLTSNVARMDVQFDGTAEKLADAISETKFGLLRVNIIGLSGSKIEISIGK